jgi:hypothetical protein
MGTGISRCNTAWSPNIELTLIDGCDIATDGKNIRLANRLHHIAELFILIFLPVLFFTLPPAT